MIFTRAKLINIVIFCIFIFCAPLAQAQMAPAGQVVVAAGRLQAIQPKQPARLLKRGSYFYAADTLITGDASEAQLRFTDGTLVALRPNTTLRIDRYQYAAHQPAAHQKGAVGYTVSLIKGGFRSLSGVIAKKDPDEYKINTSVATIGLRGTEFSLILDASGGLSAATYKGRIFLRNQAGYIEIGDGAEYQYAYVASAYSKPKGEPIRPTILLNDPRFVLTNTASQNGSSNSVGANSNAARVKSGSSQQDDFCLN